MNTDAPIHTTYARRFENVLAHIDDDLSVEALSQVAHFSKYHFHRQFSGYVGIGVTRYVQLMRLRRASRQLIAEP